ncbi:MAG TPA: DUF4900 domain-containing protein [Candidatus Omnitrophota bacterium]|nr:DUF4900 domain-containing protein [Candidatus Omnitrophota bacterium]HRZ15589.1 DUF4900 domain-containing protein [Candidatus Omnitrophota bacterium]
MKNNKGILLVIASLVMTVVAALTGVYLSSIISEKRSVNSERYTGQSLNLAEAGANYAVAEMRRRLTTVLRDNVSAVPKNQFTQRFDTPYSADLLGFVVNFAGSPAFTDNENNATLTLNMTPEDLGAEVDYFTPAGGQARLVPVISATITLLPGTCVGGDCCNNVAETCDFPFRYKVECTTKTQLLNDGADNTSNTADDVYLTRTVALSPSSEFNVVVRRDNFAKFALFTSHHGTPSGTTVWFTNNTRFSGPVHTNERFSFANNPSGTFTDEVTQNFNDARFYNNGNSKRVDADRYPVGCEGEDCHDLPTFDTGFTRGADLINLPSSITQNELKSAALGTMSEPGASSYGVYVPPYDPASPCADGTAVTGGIYIKGNQGQSSDNPDITLGSDGSGNPQYTVVRGASTSTITVNTTTNQTTVVDSTGTHILTGVPDGTGDEGILIYVNDDIKGLSGVVDKDTQVTVSAERDIVIDDNLTYEEFTPDDPATADVNELSCAGFTNLLGILSWGGDVEIGTSAPDDLVIHGVVMAPHGIFTVTDYDEGDPRGVVTLLGGAITDFYGAFGQFSGTTNVHGYGRNFVYDNRVLQGMAPPYFPYLDNFTSYIEPTDGLTKRTYWREVE